MNILQYTTNGISKLVCIIFLNVNYFESNVVERGDIMEITAEMIAAKKLVEWPILALPGVVGVGIGMLEENGILHDEVAS